MQFKKKKKLQKMLNLKNLRFHIFGVKNTSNILLMNKLCFQLIVLNVRVIKINLLRKKKQKNCYITLGLKTPRRKINLMKNILEIQNQLF